MDCSATNLLIIGPPRSGKTTLIIELSKILKEKAAGFYTKELREEGQRVGFLLCTLEGEEEVFAHKDIKSPYKVGKYGVHLQVLEKVGIPRIIEGIKKKEFIIIDEIGKMELFSNSFKEAVMEALSCPKKVVATMKEKDCAFTRAVKGRGDVRIFHTPSSNLLERIKVCLKLV